MGEDRKDRINGKGQDKTELMGEDRKRQHRTGLMREDRKGQD
jgi:hypothetical protein